MYNQDWTVPIPKFLQKMVVVHCDKIVEGEVPWLFSQTKSSFSGLWSAYDSGSCELNNSVHLFANITCYFWIPGKTLDLNTGIEIFKIISCPLKNNLSFSEWVINKVYFFFPPDHFQKRKSHRTVYLECFKDPGEISHFPYTE